MSRENVKGSSKETVLIEALDLPRFIVKKVKNLVALEKSSG